MNDSEIQLCFDLREDQKQLQIAYEMKQFLIEWKIGSTNTSFINDLQFTNRLRIIIYNENETEWLSHFIIKAIINKDVTGVSYIYGSSNITENTSEKSNFCFLIIIIVSIIFGLLS
jgi:hypothetical protein